MYLSKKEIEILEECIDGLYWDNDRMSRDGRYFLNKLDNFVNKLEKEKENNIYVITNNAIVNYEVNYSIYGIATNKKEAKNIFKKAIADAKCDSDFNEINPVEVCENNESGNAKWCYTQTDNKFELWRNGEYSSNNFSIELLKFELGKEKDLSEDYEL